MKKLLFLLIGLFLCNSAFAQTGTVTDIDGNVYKTVIIGNQEWMAENLKVTKYRNGDAIPNVTGNSEWTSTTNGAYSAYNNADSLAEIYGYLYNWYAVNDPRNIAPEGWRVPTDEEWTELVNYLGASEGGKLKEAGTAHWNSPNNGATNEYGFTALPGGYRSGSDGAFTYIGNNAIYWLFTEYSSSNAWYLYLNYNHPEVTRGNGSKNYGYSVRLVKDALVTSVDDEIRNVPKGYILSQNYPNPFNPTTSIRFEIPKVSNVTLKIYDILGQEVRTLVSQQMPAGYHNIVWDGTNNAGQQVSTGIYIYHLSTDDFSSVKKMLFIK